MNWIMWSESYFWIKSYVSFLSKCDLPLIVVLCFGFWLQYSPYKKGSKLTKARRAKALGLEVATSTLMNTPHTLDLMAWVKPDTEGGT